MPYDLPCPHCKRNIDYKAHVCPYCTQAVNTGYEDSGGRSTFLIGALIGLLLIPLGHLIGGEDTVKMEGLKQMYFGDIWWFGWIIMPVGGGAMISWIVAASKRRNA